MISQVAVTGSLNQERTKIRQFRARLSRPVLRKTAVALVLLAFSAVLVRAQEPEQWPQDDDYAGVPQNPQPYNYPQADPQQGDYAQPYPQQPANGDGTQPAAPTYMPSQAMTADQLDQLIA